MFFFVHDSFAFVLKLFFNGLETLIEQKRFQLIIIYSPGSVPTSVAMLKCYLKS